MNNLGPNVCTGTDLNSKVGTETSRQGGRQIDWKAGKEADRQVDRKTADRQTADGQPGRQIDG